MAQIVLCCIKQNNLLQSEIEEIISSYSRGDNYSVVLPFCLISGGGGHKLRTGDLSCDGYNRFATLCIFVYKLALSVLENEFRYSVVL